MKIQRIMGIDGFSWCSLHGGPNMATYKKPLVDYLGYVKLAFYINRAVFQPVVAGSSDVDVVYGPADAIHPVVMHLGGSRTVDVHISVKDMDGAVVAERSYAGIALPSGRGTAPLPEFRPRVPGDGHYAVEYRVVESRYSDAGGPSPEGAVVERAENHVLEEEMHPPDETG